MNANHLQFDIAPKDSASLIPWIIVLACTAILVVQVSLLAQQIPDSLLQQAIDRVDPSIHPSVSISANGRDLSVSGSTSSTQTRDEITDQLMEIEGVLSVHNTLQVIDPELQSLQAGQQFQAQLSSLDFSAIAFRPGSITFTPQSDTALSQLQVLLTQYPGSRIRIEGHTDNTGAENVNIRLSRDRANAVANYLLARGVLSEQLIVTGYGATQPVADNSTESGRALNRRIDISVVN